MMKLCILDRSTVSSGDISADIFSEFGKVNCASLCRNEDAAEVIGDSDIALCNKVLITNEVMDKCPDLKYIGLFATGYNNIDIPAGTAPSTSRCIPFASRRVVEAPTPTNKEKALPLERKNNA